MRFLALTEIEFNRLPRYANGRIVDLPKVAACLTPSQVDSLHEDDWSHRNELIADCEYELYLLRKGF